MKWTKYSASVDHRECWGEECGRCGHVEVDPDPKGTLYRADDVDAALRDLIARWRVDVAVALQDASEYEEGSPHWKSYAEKARVARTCADALEALLPK